jgi:hypothetical protein
MEVEQVEIFWEPLNFFRLSPTLTYDGLTLLVGLTLIGVTTACLLGIRTSTPRRTTWHGLILVALAGCLLLAMSANLLTLALGSALLDLALIALALSSPNREGRVVWRFAVLGILSTLLLLVSTLWMSVEVGSASLLARDIPHEALLLIAVAGVLRLFLYPLHARGLHTPENAVTQLLPVGAGIYLLARVQSISPILADETWMLAASGLALFAGGLLAWSGGASSTARLDDGSEPTRSVWSGLSTHQSGYALAFVILLAVSAPWPVLSLILALATLAIWWDTNLEQEPAPTPRWLAWIVDRMEPWQKRAQSYLTDRAPTLERWRTSWFARRGGALLPAIALASLAGAPLTAGAVGRWSLYAALLHERESALLIATLIADTLLATGLWLALNGVRQQVGERRPKPAGLLAMLVLIVLLVVLGIAPGGTLRTLGMKPISLPDVSAWGLGLIFVLPWLLGGWLARAGTRFEGIFAQVHRAADLEWAYSLVDWVGQKLVDGVAWLGKVGEGEGWWGWALIILAIGAIFMLVR